MPKAWNFREFLIYKAMLNEECGMSSQEVKLRLEETIRSVRELLVALMKAAHEQLNRTPRIAHVLDKVFDGVTKELSETLELISKRTSREQLELLEAYRSLLQKQMEFVEARIRVLEEDRSRR